MIDVERNELLGQFAYAHWRSRGCPLNSREVDWAYALIMLEEFKWESMRILDTALLEIKSTRGEQRVQTQEARSATY